MKKNRMSWLACGLAVSVTIFAVAYQRISSTVWAHGFDPANCAGCHPVVDWQKENEVSVSTDLARSFHTNGAVVLPSFLSQSKVSNLAHHVDNELPNTWMTDVLARIFLPQYLRYEHRLDTRSELLRDWAVHGPLGRWASELLRGGVGGGVGGADDGEMKEEESQQQRLPKPAIRLYNVEAIYHHGSTSSRPCGPAWHRDTIAAPFDTTVPAVVFNVYLEETGPDGPHGDGLIYIKGSHLNVSSPPKDHKNNLYEPTMRVGDVLAHDPNSYHTTSGRGCWRRRSLQFRYVSASAAASAADEEEDDTNDTGGTTTTTRFHFDRNRFPHGPIPWSLAQSPDMYPHGLKDGDELSGPGYPLVYPKPLPSEHVPLPGAVWTVAKVLSTSRETQRRVVDKDGNVTRGFMTLDGPVLDPASWTMQEIPGSAGLLMPMHKDSPAYQAATTTATTKTTKTTTTTKGDREKTAEGGS